MGHTVPFSEERVGLPHRFRDSMTWKLSEDQDSSEEEAILLWMLQPDQTQVRMKTPGGPQVSLAEAPSWLVDMEAALFQASVGTEAVGFLLGP